MDNINFDPDTGQDEFLEYLERKLFLLSDYERRAYRWHTGLDGPERSAAEIGELLSISESQVESILCVAVEKIIAMLIASEKDD